MSVKNEIERIQNAKASIKTAIENKGVNVGDGLLDTYPQYIESITTSEDLDAELNTYEEEVTNQKTKLEEIAEVLKTKGVLEAKELNITPTEEEQSFEGLYNQVNVDKIPTEEKTIELDFSNTDVVEITSSENAYLKKVTINKDEDLISENIKSGTNIFGVEGSFEGGGETSDVEIKDCSNLFYYDSRISEIDVILPLCKNPTNMRQMFNYCGTLTSVDLSKMNTINVTDMSSLFISCSKLTNINLNGFNTSNVTNMRQMFSGCSSLISIDVSNFNTNGVIDMVGMFQFCSKLTELDVSNFNTSNVTSINSMFQSCSKLTELDVSNFNTSNVTDMGSTFRSCSLLAELNLSNFDGSKVKSIGNIFNSCNGLTNLNFMTNLGKGYTQKTNNHSSYKLDLSYATKLTHDSLMDVINKLYDLNLAYNVAGGGTLYTQQLVLGTTNKAKLTADEIAIATNKGWVVS